MKARREYVFMAVRGLSDIMDFVRGFLLINILGGAFGSEVFGTWGLVEQIYSVAVILSGLGLSQSVIRYLAGEHKVRYVRRICLVSSGVILLAGALLTALAALLVPQIADKVIKDGGAEVFLRAALPLILINTLELFLDGCFRARLRINQHSVIRMLFTALTLASYFYAARRGYGLREMIFLTLGVKGAYVFVLYAALALLEFFGGREEAAPVQESDKDFALPGESGTLSALKGMLVFGAPLMLLGLSNWLLGTCGKVILGYQGGGAGTVGRYDASLKIAMLIQYLGMPLAYTLLPLLADAVSKKGKDAVCEICRRFARLYFFLALPLLAGLLATHNDLMDLMTAGREEFHASMAFFLIPLLAALASQTNAFYHDVIFLKGNSRFLFLANFISAAFCLILNLLFTERFGMWCTASASLLSYLLLILLCALKVRSYGFAPLEFLDLRFFFKSLVSALLMFAAVLGAGAFLPGQGIGKLALLVLTGMLAYAFLVLARNRFSPGRALRELVG